jgi:hypothetical protein
LIKTNNKSTAAAGAGLMMKKIRKTTARAKIKTIKKGIKTRSLTVKTTERKTRKKATRKKVMEKAIKIKMGSLKMEKMVTGNLKSKTKTLLNVWKVK